MTVVCTRTGWPARSPAQAAAVESSSDEKLIERIAQGDQLAMRTLFARHRVMLYRWLRRLIGDETLAEDLLSEVFLDVWRQAASFEARASVSTWLLAIARHKALSARRRRSDVALDEEMAAWRAGKRSGGLTPAKAGEIHPRRHFSPRRHFDGFRCAQPILRALVSAAATVRNIVPARPAVTWTRSRCAARMLE